MLKQVALSVLAVTMLVVSVWQAMDLFPLAAAQVLGIVLGALIAVSLGWILGRRHPGSSASVASSSGVVLLLVTLFSTSASWLVDMGGAFFLLLCGVSLMAGLATQNFLGGPTTREGEVS